MSDTRQTGKCARDILTQLIYAWLGQGIQQWPQGLLVAGTYHKTFFFKKTWNWVQIESKIGK
jgi:hypothetical protein